MLRWSWTLGMPPEPSIADYDTAVQVGAHLGLTPGKVYLHKGTVTGIPEPSSVVVYLELEAGV
jgi:hypothetical protein